MRGKSFLVSHKSERHIFFFLCEVTHLTMFLKPPFVISRKMKKHASKRTSIVVACQFVQVISYVHNIILKVEPPLGTLLAHFFFFFFKFWLRINTCFFNCFNLCELIFWHVFIISLSLFSNLVEK